MQFVYAGLFSKIFDSLLRPITEFIGNIISKTLDYVYEYVLEPVITLALKLFWDFMKLDIFNMFNKFLEKVENLLGGILNCMMKVAGILVGAEEVKSHGRNVKLLEAMIQDPFCKNAFFGIMILSFALVGALSMYSMIKAHLGLDPGDRRTMSSVLRSMMHAYLTFIGGYVYVLAVIWIGSELIHACGYLVSAVSGHSTASIGGVVTKVREAVVGMYPGLVLIGFVVSIISGISLINVMLRVIGGIVRRIYDVIVLYIMQPFFAVSIILDGGERYRQYKNRFVGRVLSGMGTYLAILLVTDVWIPYIAEAELDSGSPIANILMQLLLTIGGVKSCEHLSDMLVTVIGGGGAAMSDRQGRAQVNQTLRKIPILGRL